MLFQGFTNILYRLKDEKQHLCNQVKHTNEIITYINNKFSLGAIRKQLAFMTI